jgi:murein DD-endopeptidase MepM/ murein hydrolase activator NlpD
VPSTGLCSAAGRRSRARLGLAAGCALAGVLLLAPGTAPAADYQTASGPRDAGGPSVSTAMRGKQLFFDNQRKVEFLFRIRHSEPVRATLTVTSPGSGEVVETWRRTVTDASEQSVTWSGVARSKLQKERKYAFRLKARDANGDETYSASSNDTTRDTFELRHHRFPVRGGHQYWDGFGAGRGHQGTDVGANCGTRLQAARGGRVQYAGYHSAAGHYLVIDARKTGRDYAYMHLTQPPQHRTGDRVRTAESIGRVGESGNASGCHLHFEMWSEPGWYEGGHAIDSEPHLRSWDRFS